MFVQINRSICLVLLIVCLLPKGLANDLTVLLLPPENGSFRKANQAIYLEFPNMLVENLNTQLALEIDAIDVSSMVTIEGQRIIFTPPSPMVLGMHQMRLVEYAANGDIIELGSWSFEIRQSAAFREQQLAIGASINNSYLVAKDYSYGEPDIDEYTADGSATLAYQAINANSAINFAGELLYTDQVDNSIGSERVDLGQYLLGVDIGKQAHFDIGHHSINHNSLIYNDFSRRGISGRFTLPNINSAVQVFSSRTNDLQGFNHVLGVEDSDNRISGIALDYQPFNDTPELLTISTSYVSGKRSDREATMGMLVEESSGDASSIAFDSQLLNRALRIRLEAAQSQFDFDGDNNGFDADRDNAYRFITQYTAQPTGATEEPLWWDISLEKIIVEPNFYTLSNAYLASDRDFTQLTANLSKGPWWSQLFINREEDNLDKRFSSTNNTLAASLVLGYSQTSPRDDSLLGTPSYRLSYSQARQNQDGVELDTMSMPLPANDNKTHYMELFSEFVYPRGSWYFLVSENKFTDNSSLQSDSKVGSIELSSRFKLLEAHSTTASITSRNIEENDTKLSAEELIYRLGLESTLERAGITSFFTVEYQEFMDDINAPPALDNSRLQFGFALAKELSKPKDLFPGVDLHLRGAYSDTDDRSTMNDDSDFYEVFLDLNVYWDVQRPQFVVNP